MMWKAEQCAGKDRREICSVAYGKFKLRQVINDNIPPFFTEAFRAHVMERDEQRSILFTR